MTTRDFIGACVAIVVTCLAIAFLSSSPVLRRVVVHCPNQPTIILDSVYEVHEVDTGVNIDVVSTIPTQPWQFAGNCTTHSIHY